MNDNLRDTWATPKPLFENLNREYNFTRDICANRDNAKIPDDYVTVEMDGLNPKHWIGQRIWCNPPFSQKDKWLRLAKRMAISKECPISVVLLPATPGVEWFQLAASGGELHFFTSRTAYLPPKGVRESSPAFGSMLCIFKAGVPVDDVTCGFRGIFRDGEGIRLSDIKDGRLL